MRSQSDWTRVVAAVLIGAGVVLLALRQFAWQLSGSMWPFVIIVPGVALFAVGATMSTAGKYLALVGALVTGTGLILLAQNLTDYYQSWAYLWTLLPVFAGLSLLYTGRRDSDDRALGLGRALVITGGVLFVVFIAAFEGLIFHSGFLGSSLVLPLILILHGVILLFRMPGSGKGGSSGDGPSGPAPA